MALGSEKYKKVSDVLFSQDKKYIKLSKIEICKQSRQHLKIFQLISK